MITSNHFLRVVLAVALLPTPAVVFITATLVSDVVDASDFPKSGFRYWTTATGVRSTVQLRALGVANNKVRLARLDGGVVELPLKTLSAEDLAYLRKLRADVQPDGASADGAGQTAIGASGAWPRWRGPNNDGISSEQGLLNSWPANGPPLLWSAGDLGSGHSSVSVWNEMIFTMGAKDGQSQLISLSVDGGKHVWSTPMGGGDAPNCTPTVDPASKLVFGVTHAGQLMCARAETGEKVWERNFADDFGGRMMSMWGYSESPLVDGPHLICTPGSDRAVVAALDKKTGNTVWATAMPSGSAGYASPVVSNACGIKQYVTLVGKGLIGVAADDGRLLWKYERIANTTANVPTPIVYGDFVFGSSGYGDGGSALIQLHRQGRGIRVQEVYYLKNNQLQNHHGGMIRIGEVVYMGEGHNKGLPVCFDLKQGKPLWGPVRGPGSGSAAITAADGKLYFRYQDGVMALIDISTKRFQVDGQFKVKTRHGEGWAHPVIANKRLYLRDQHELHCYDVGA